MVAGKIRSLHLLSHVVHVHKTTIAAFFSVVQYTNWIYERWLYKQSQAHMHWVFTIVFLVVAVIAFFVWANYRTKKEHAAFTKSDVVAAIENVLSNGYHDEWDLFLAWHIEDSYLESVRQRCIVVSNEYSGTEKEKDIATSGETKLHEILDELKGRA